MNKTRISRFSPCVLLFFALGTSALADSRIECGSLASKILHLAVRYCTLLPPSYDSDTQRRFPVLYFLHGLGDNEQSLINTAGWNLIEDLREQGKIGDFIVVTPAAGRSFYVNSYDGRTRYSDFFIREFIPAIERKYRIRANAASRAIGGVSMGGYGALRFAFAYPHLFSSVSAHSAALLPQPVEKLRNAMDASPRMSALLGDVFGRPINAAHWAQNSPFVLVDKNHSEIAHLKIYFDCGRSDEYGFNEGAQELQEKLDALKIRHESYIYTGNHGLVSFLEHLPASMEFHSRAFGAKSNAAGRGIPAKMEP
jgi:S-formylglutathione hydrolase FrmB